MYAKFLIHSICWPGMEEALSKKNANIIFPSCHWKIIKLFSGLQNYLNWTSSEQICSLGTIYSEPRWRPDCLDCSSCWLLAYELVVSVQTDTWLFKVREKYFFFNRPLIRCGWVRRVWVTTQMTSVNLEPRGREEAFKSKHIVWNWRNWSQVSATGFCWHTMYCLEV